MAADKHYNLPQLANTTAQTQIINEIKFIIEEWGRNVMNFSNPWVYQRINEGEMEGLSQIFEKIGNDKNREERENDEKKWE